MWGSLFNALTYAFVHCIRYCHFNVGEHLDLVNLFIQLDFDTSSGQVNQVKLTDLTSSVLTSQLEISIFRQ